ncbi:MAG: hypothetical protein K1X89_07205 [Myxococcaceae bacterium]|nr:hypothetical protein [Myxococcaceae bacterium]
MTARKAAVLGVVLGFALAAAPSCGNGKPPGSCTTSNCAGCCSGTQCVTPTSDAACGQNGTTCQACTNGAVCMGGSCQGGSGGGSGSSGGGSAGGGSPSVCNTCRTSSGQCALASSVSSCGTDGGFCRTCQAEEYCIGGVCQPPSCTPANCADGCCVGTACVRQQSNTQCGLNGKTCSDCMTGTCNADAGTCVAPPPDAGGITVDDAGIPTYPDGGLVGCSAQMPCVVGCCIDPIGFCIIGNNDIFCGGPGTVCDYCAGSGRTCNLTSLTCQ